MDAEKEMPTEKGSWRLTGVQQTALQGEACLNGLPPARTLLALLGQPLESGFCASISTKTTEASSAHSKLHSCIPISIILGQSEDSILTNQDSALWTNQTVRVWSPYLHEHRPIGDQGRGLLSIYSSSPLAAGAQFPSRNRNSGFASKRSRTDQSGPSPGPPHGHAELLVPELEHRGALPQRCCAVSMLRFSSSPHPEWGFLWALSWHRAKCSV